MYNLDFLSHKPKVFVYKQDRYYSKTGITLSLLSLAAMLSLIIYFIIVTFSRTNIFIRFSTSNKYPKMLNLTNAPIMFSILDAMGKQINNPEKIYNFYLTYLNFIPGNTTLGTSTKIMQDIVLLERCQRADFTGTLFETYPDLELNFCNRQKKNLTIYGKYGDMTNGFGILNLMVNKCSNTSLFYKGRDCADSDTINMALAKNSLLFTYLDNDIDHTNVNNPYESYINTEMFDIGISTFQRIYFNIKNVFYETANGFVFDFTDSVTFAQKDSIKFYTDNRASGYLPETFTTLFITISDKTDVYNRAYIKLQDLLANIGGVVNGIFTIANILMNILTYRLNAVGLVENLYKLEERRDFHTHTIVEVNKCMPSLSSNTSVLRFNNKSISPISELGKDIGKVLNKNARVEPVPVDILANKPNFNLNLLEYLCPFNIGRKGSSLDLLNRYEKVIRHELSIDNIINKSGEVNKLVELLTVEQKANFRKMNALNLTLLKILE
jgi:hypothetical protein